MREKLPAFGERGVHLACIVQGTEQEAARFCGRHDIAPQCIPDPDKVSYQAMGFPRTTWKAILLGSPELKRRRAEAAEAGCGINLRGTFQEHSDVMQLPGAALIARGGRILWLHRGTHPGDLPSAEDLLKLAGEKLGGALAAGAG